jgi:hypothetical protein
MLIVFRPVSVSNAFKTITELARQITAWPKGGLFPRFG